jgi:hypothetical protein
MNVAISRPPGQLEQPGRRVVREMGEHRDRVDEVEAAVLQRQRRDGDRLPGVERRAEVLLHPLDARPVDVAAPELGGPGLVGEVAQRAPRARAEVEHPLARERPVIRKEPDDLALGLRAQLQVRGVGIAPVQAVDPRGELRWRQGQIL